MPANNGVIAAWGALRARPLASLLVASAALKLVYVFLLTDYPSYLFSDFAGYWDRAHERMAGGDLSYRQWAYWPPLAHILLAWYLRLLGLLGLSSRELEATLVLNVAASTASVALLYDIALETLKRRAWALGVAALYAFSFPLVYLNAFVMSEHGATLFMLAAVWLVLRYRRPVWALAAAGVLLGVATAMRPAFGIFGLPAALCLALADGGLSRATIIRAGAFSCGFFVLVALSVAEVHRISQGRLLGLSANGAVAFYFAQCRTSSLSFSYQGQVYSFATPAYFARPELGTAHFDLVTYDQRVFRDLAWRCMREEPHPVAVLAERARDLFFGPLLPSAPSAAGFGSLLPVFRWFLLVCALLAPLAFAVRRAHGVATDALGLLAGMLAASLALFSMLMTEHRYLYPLVPLLYVVVAAVLVAATREPRRMALAGAAWAVALGAPFVLAVGMKDGGSDPLVLTEIRRFAAPYGSAGIEPELARLKVRRLRDPGVDRLWRSPGGEDEAFALHRACMDVRIPGLYELQVVTGMGFALRIDGRTLLSQRDPGTYRWRVELPAGRHAYALRMDRAVGVTATWRRVVSPAGDFTPALGMHYIGEAGEEVAFLPPESC